MALWIALACGFFSFLLLYLFFITRLAPKTQIKERMQNLRRPVSLDEQVRFESEQLHMPFTARIIVPFLQQLENRLSRLAPASIAAMLADRIMRAGKQHIWSVNAFVCFWLFSCIAFIVIMVFYAFSVKLLPFIQGFGLVLCAMIAGALLPVAFLNSLVAKRQQAILRQLPDVLDLLCVSVQAGLSFDGALLKVTGKMQGPLIDECDKMLRDTRMGMTRRIALTNLANRCQLQEIHLFTASIIQSDRLGVSLARTLLIQAENMRERRRQTIKELALKAPVKMLLPLAVFIFPVLFAVVLYPTVFSILRNMGALTK